MFNLSWVSIFLVPIPYKNKQNSPISVKFTFKKFSEVSKINLQGSILVSWILETMKVDANATRNTVLIFLSSAVLCKQKISHLRFIKSQD